MTTAAPATPEAAASGAEEVGSSLWSDAWRRLRKNRVAVAAGVVLILLTLLCIIHPEFAAHPYDQANLKLGPTPPSAEHWMGTDDLGRDLFARVTFGGRVSLAVGVIATIISFAIGVSWGGIAGYFGKRLDALMMRFVDVLYTIPLLIIVILLTAFYAKPGTIFHDAFVGIVGVFSDHPEDPKYQPLFKITFVFAVLGSVSWLTMARIVRGQVISLRSQPFVEAARSIGVRDLEIVFRHLLPGFTSHIIVVLTMSVPAMILGETSLSFLGLGLRTPIVSWGVMLQDCLSIQTVANYPWLLMPVVFVVVTVLCFNFLGDGLRDAADPYADA
jgi:oligopeptide transport system permease protein